MFCNKCGCELTTDSEFCNKCGAPVERFADEPEMTLEESIAFAEKFKARYLSVEKLAREVADNEATIARPVRQTTGQYSFFRFFWKYLIFAAVSFFACDILALLHIKITRYADRTLERRSNVFVRMQIIEDLQIN